MATDSPDTDKGFDPMHQFEVQTLFDLPQFGGLDPSITNSALWMIIAVFGIIFTLGLAARRTALVPGRMQLLGEMTYSFIANMVRQNIGTEGMRFLPFIFTLFMFILFCNLLGMIPYSFTVTSHLIVTFALASVVFIMIILVGLIKNGFGFFKLFVPSGVPMIMLPLLAVIEFISFLTRPVSLSVRLFGNMLAGHTILKIFASFVVGLSAAGLVPLAIAPFGLMVAFTALEFLIAALQAYVFAILTCIYLNDVIHIHH